MITLLRSPLPFLLLLFLGSVPGLKAESTQMRPALLGNQKRSLINLINAESLMKRGQKDGLIMFGCFISNLGFGYGAETYRGTPNSELLAKEVIGRAEQAQYEPAMYRGSPVGVYLVGTVVFAIKDGKPHLRIFLNQENEDVLGGRDFVAPQLAFVPGNVKFKGIYYPQSTPGHPGVAAVTINVDTLGNPSGLKLAYEHPPKMNFGAAAMTGLVDALFIPGFRNGKPTNCRFTLPIVFFGPSFKMKTG